MVFTLLTGTLFLTKITFFFFTEIAVYSQSIEFADSGNHDDVSYSSVTVVKRLNAGDSVLIRTTAESNLASRRNIVSFHGGRSTFSGWRIF